MKKFKLICCSLVVTAALQAQVSDSLMLYCTFDDVNSITNPVAGPGGTFNANPVTNFTTGQVGNAYFSNYYESDLVYFPKEVIPPDRGCVEFWGRLYNMPEYVNDNWGHCPAFWRTTNQGEWTMEFEFSGNNGMGGAGLCGRVGLMANGWQGSCATGFWQGYYTFSSILGDVNAWHHYALSWDINGVPGAPYTMQMFIDGIPIGSCNWNNEYYCLVVAPVPTFGDFKIITFQMGQGSVAIDELKIWNYAKTQFIEQVYIYTVLNDQVLCKNEDATFEVKAVGIPPIDYQWQKDGLNMPGATDSIFLITQAQPDNAGYYRCIASNNYGTDTSNTAQLSVEFAIPTVINGPANVIEYQVVLYSIPMQDGHTNEFLVVGGNEIENTDNTITVHWGSHGQGFIKLIETSEIGCVADTVNLYITIGHLGINDLWEKIHFSVSPNPFSNLTTFSFTLQQNSDIRLEIFNCFGQKIDELVNSIQSPGSYKVSWNALEFLPGVYYYQIKAGEETGTGKMILMK